MMNRTQIRRPAVPLHWRTRHIAHDTIEWEELPSLAPALRRSEFASSTRHVWSSTERMELQPVETSPAPFVESIEGLHVREIANVEVFRHFFGDPTANH